MPHTKAGQFPGTDEPVCGIAADIENAGRLLNGERQRKLGWGGIGLSCFHMNHLFRLLLV